ncbi:zinc ABC transporter substrate-binding protein [Caldibacillus thermolactis]|jgi:zinc transport system substrate-binding protein|uniref:Zinc ABC transporter substrate-binding protein n=1 Tax=Pallidibacillus thermolactis TaxID=251051 RepID=A0ABT2WGB4_9BACI|nr:zinc ABC transporter substrate-binding protein [Pallidibacillus thermolactis]MCU9594735.1 zinc ABC transporter substrate-binding protein [Pallidibacillus thermolactis]
MKKLLIATISFLLIILLTGCNVDRTKEDTEGKLIVHTSVYPLEDFTKKIGGEFVRVKSIYPPGIDEHSYEPSQKDIIDMANGDLFFYIGHNLEGFMHNAEPILKDEGVNVIAIGEKVQIDETEKPQHDHEQNEHDEHEEHEDHGHQHGSIDPHLWLDPIYAKQMAIAIKDALSKAMPEQKAYFEENLTNLVNRLDDLHKKFETLAETAKVKQFVVSHSAYGYWEKRYGLKQLNISGISTSQEPSQKQLVEIINEIDENHLQYLLVEQNVSNKLVNVIQNETTIDTLPIHNLAVLTKQDIENGEDYFSLMKNNLETLKKALNP